MVDVILWVDEESLFFAAKLLLIDRFKKSLVLLVDEKLLLLLLHEWHIKWPQDRKKLLGVMSLQQPLH